MSDSEKNETGLVHVGSVGLAKVQNALRLTNNLVNSFESVLIGKQEWMVRNLNVSHFRNGDLIPEISDAKEWKIAGSEGKPAWCYYDNDPLNGEKHGKLYNWHAVNDRRGLAPKGWSVASNENWIELISCTLNIDVPQIKQRCTGWETIGSRLPLDKRGFQIKLGGSRSFEGEFHGRNSHVYWWTSSEEDSLDSFCWLLDTDPDEGISSCWLSKKNGFSVRCIKSPKN